MYGGFNPLRGLFPYLVFGSAVGVWSGLQIWQPAFEELARQKKLEVAGAGPSAASSQGAPGASGATQKEA